MPPVKPTHLPSECLRPAYTFFTRGGNLYVGRSNDIRGRMVGIRGLVQLIEWLHSRFGWREKLLNLRRHTRKAKARVRADENTTL